MFARSFPLSLNLLSISSYHYVVRVLERLNDLFTGQGQRNSSYAPLSGHEWRGLTLVSPTSGRSHKKRGLASPVHRALSLQPAPFMAGADGLNLEMRQLCFTPQTLTNLYINGTIC